MPIETSAKASIEQELVTAKAREHVANRKLKRLKERFDKLKSSSEAQLAQEREQNEARLHDSSLANQELAARCKALQDEAAMWKSQLFDQLDRLDDKQLEHQSLQAELAQAQWQLVELVDLERSRCELELAKSQLEAQLLQKELVTARTQVDGLKTLGACLSAKLDRATGQSSALKRENARLAEVAETRAHLLEAEDQEIGELKNELFETRRQLLAHRLQSDSWEMLKSGLTAVEPERAVPEMGCEPHFAAHKPEGRRPLKVAGLPSQSSAVAPAPSQLVRRATEKLGGWFNLTSKS